MRIQDLERITGMERATIRFYERQGMIAPQRGENGYRDYSEEDAEGILRQVEFAGKLEYDQTVIEHLILAAAAARKDAKLMELVSLKAGTTVNREIRNPIYCGTNDGTFSVAGIDVSWKWDSATDLITITIEWK